MKKISAIAVIVFLLLMNVTKALAGTLTVSSDNLNFSQPLQVLSDPSTTLQLAYDFNIYHHFICMDLRGRTAQQSGNQTLQVNTGDDIAVDRITILPSFDAGVKIKLLNNYPLAPYVFSLINYTTLNATAENANGRTTSDISAFGLKAGMGMDILLSSQLPSWLFNVDMGYEYLPITLPAAGTINMNGIFLSLGFGLSF